MVQWRSGDAVNLLGRFVRCTSSIEHERQPITSPAGLPSQSPVSPNEATRLRGMTEPKPSFKSSRFHSDCDAQPGFSSSCTYLHSIVTVLSRTAFCPSLVSKAGETGIHSSTVVIGFCMKPSRAVCVAFEGSHRQPSSPTLTVRHCTVQPSVRYAVAGLQTLF